MSKVFLSADIEQSQHYYECPATSEVYLSAISDRLTLLAQTIFLVGLFCALPSAFGFSRTGLIGGEDQYTQQEETGRDGFERCIHTCSGKTNRKHLHGIHTNA